MIDLAGLKFPSEVWLIQATTYNCVSEKKKELEKEIIPWVGPRILTQIWAGYAVKLGRIDSPRCEVYTWDYVSVLPKELSKPHWTRRECDFIFQVEGLDNDPRNYS